MSTKTARQSGTNPSGAIRPLWVVEKETIETAIHVCEGNIPKAAALLEISPSTIYRKRATWLDLSANSDDMGAD